jgi:adenine-specific DNA-methyltransferase
MRAHLEKREALRVEEQVRLDLLKSAVERNEWGQFATPPALAAEMASYVRELWRGRRDKVRFLDPAIGTGSFFSALRKADGPGWLASASGIELDANFADAAASLWAGEGLRVTAGDFTKLQPPAAGERPNLILTNPPYVRHHHLDQEDKVRLKTTASAIAGTEVSGLTGLYCYFMFLAHEWLADGGIGVWLVPSEFMDVNYGRAVQQYLATRVKLLHVHRFDPQKVQFDDALVSSAIVVYEKRKPTAGHRVRFSYGGSLLKPELSELVAVRALRESRKWSGFGRDAESVRHERGNEATTLSSLFAVKRGIATGANGFFILARAEAERLGISENFLKPVLPSPRELHETIINADRRGYPQVENPRAVIDTDLSEEEIREACPGLWQYLKRGEEQGIPDLYLASKRRPWYRQEQRPAAPFLCTYMGRSGKDKAPFRFFWNRSRATATNVYLLLYPTGALKAALEKTPRLQEKVFELLRGIESTALLSEGRVYGGGLHKLEPAELGNLDVSSFVDQLGIQIPHKVPLVA